MDTLKYLIENCLAAQKRTGRNRQFVFYKRNEVYKGPYSKTKLDTIMERSKQLRVWNTPLIVHPIRVEDEWLVFPNIAEDYEMKEYSRNQETFSNYSYDVVERVGVDKLNNVIMKNKWVYDCVDLIEAMVHLWILGVGDTGIFNILVDIHKKLIYVIDIDETASEERTDELFYFSKHPAKKFNWYENVRKHYVTVAERLETIKYENQEKVQRAIDLLLKYGQGDESESESEDTNDGGKKLGKMEWHGPMGGTITYSGFKLDEVKSGLQKYIRRGIVDKALQCAFEIYRISEITDSKGVITNLYNRLKIIAVEDIGLAGYSLVIDVMKLINDESRSPEELIAIVESLANSKKTRLCSHVNAAYRVHKGREYAYSQGILIDENIEKEDLPYVKNHMKREPFSHITDHEMRKCAIMMYKRMKEDDLNAIKWFADYEVLAESNKTRLTRAYEGKKTTNSIVHLFEVIELFGNKEAMETIRKAYFTIAENKRDDKKYFIIFAILAAMYELEYKSTNLTYTNDLEPLLNGEYKLKLDSYVYDKHTSEGSQHGMNRNNFVNEGALINNEDMVYHINELEDVYLNYI